MPRGGDWRRLHSKSLNTQHWWSENIYANYYLHYQYIAGPCCLFVRKLSQSKRWNTSIRLDRNNTALFRGMRTAAERRRLLPQCGISWTLQLTNSLWSITNYILIVSPIYSPCVFQNPINIWALRTRFLML